MNKEYDLPKYWDSVADQIKQREAENVIAGDDEPFYRYKRESFLKYFKQIPFAGKSVLEVGCGPGGNLNVVNKLGAKEITGVDVSSSMIDIAKKNVDARVMLVLVNGTELPFRENEFDIVFTSTVLQHNTNEKSLHALIKEICRVAKSDVYIFERIEKVITGHESNTGRPVSYYKEAFERNGLRLESSDLLPIQTSYYVSGAIRKIFSSKNRKEGEPLNKFAILLQQLTLPITKRLDKIIKPTRDLGLLHFKKITDANRYNQVG